MSLAAVTYKVKPGHEDEIAEIFSPQNFRRAGSPDMKNDRGETVGHIIGTGLFIQNDIMVRVIQYEGDIADVGRRMAGQPGVQEAEERLGRYLQEPRDTTTQEGFMRYFRNSLMRCVQERSSGRPGEIAAFLHRIKPGHEDEIAAAFADVPKGASTTLRNEAGEDAGEILGVALFVKDNALIRTVCYTGDIADLGRYLSAWGSGARLGQRLAPYLDEEPTGDTPEDLAAAFQRSVMRRISMLSVANAPAPA